MLTGSRKRLRTLFREIDKDGTGSLSQLEFNGALDDAVFREEFCDAACMKYNDVKELFSFLCHKQSSGQWKTDYEDFIEKLELEGKDVRERSVFRVEKQMSLLEQRLDAKLDHVRRTICQPEKQSLNFERIDLFLPSNNEYPINLTPGEIKGLTNHFVVGMLHKTAK